MGLGIAAVASGMHRLRKLMGYRGPLPLPAPARYFYLCLCLALAGCAGGPQPPLLKTVPVRFVLSFDDGPSGEAQDNPTESILDTLRDNPVQPGIRAVYFVQTRSEGGATARGRALVRREHAEGHMLALHDGSPLGHPSHRNLDAAALERSLSDGLADIETETGLHVAVVRPPYWAYDDRTLTAYRRHGLAVLLTDITANDGKDWGFRASPRREVHMAAEMRRLRERLQRAELPEMDGAAPVVVAFHDTNSFTARHMTEYLRMLVDEARAAGLAVATPPFYGDSTALEGAVRLRAEAGPLRDMVPWWWRWMLW